jgi:hypothetical protein
MALNVSNSDIVLTTAAQQVAVAVSPEQFAMLSVTATNTGASAASITVYRVASGGSAGAGNEIALESIAAGSTITLPLAGMTLTNGQSLQALASVAAQVNLNASWAQTP